MVLAVVMSPVAWLVFATIKPSGSRKEQFAMEFREGEEVAGQRRSRRTRRSWRSARRGLAWSKTSKTSESAPGAEDNGGGAGGDGAGDSRAARRLCTRGDATKQRETATVAEVAPASERRNPRTFEW